MSAPTDPYATARAQPTCGNCGGPKPIGAVVCQPCIGAVLAEVLADLPARFDAAVARHRASGAASTTREEADRRAAEAVANAYRAMGMEPPP